MIYALYITEIKHQRKYFKRNFTWRKTTILGMMVKVVSKSATAMCTNIRFDEVLISGTRKTIAITKEFAKSATVMLMA